ncbi:uncharacterized protein LOC134256179 [Saccostrea cucullata]|uniref:uncharacterized protein LOC134256179 n=1 Tax=Saccostrea cuccullata TaxID=36930 RepID=UPI002ED360C9
MSLSDTVQIMAESNSIIYGNTSNPSNSDSDVSLHSIHSLLIQMNSRLCEIESKMSQLNVIQSDVAKIKTKVTDLDSEIKNIHVRSEFKDLESNVSSLGLVFDSVKDTAEAAKKQAESNKNDIKRAGHEYRAAQSQTERDIQLLNKENAEIRDSIIDLKARSMRDNLVFSGIPEQKGEDTEEVLQLFLRKKFRLDCELSFERVHRMGKFREFSEKPRNIVAKFTYFKDREYIRIKAPHRLHGCNIWVNEQFPAEIEERRKKLYPVMRQARQDRCTTKLVRDVLYINGKVYTPPPPLITEMSEETPSFRSSGQSSHGNRWTQNQQTPRGERPTQKRPRTGSTPDRTDD